MCDSGSKERHKATTRNGVPQGIGRPQHTPSQTDTVVRFALEHVVLFLCLCDLGSKGTPQRLLLVMAFLVGRALVVVSVANLCFAQFAVRNGVLRGVFSYLSLMLLWLRDIIYIRPQGLFFLCEMVLLNVRNVISWGMYDIDTWIVVRIITYIVYV